ncbi:uncharacterized protein N7469_001230 [Penicillium citrinum]|uniref:Uncharacterized protein n=1 Tax=Penicillium citrinum TaxID=5077 RepID=A0A9W9TVP3_PENCI|nr:uncharacterized protein N7469_001230 [Penicillium citrinum]KAJ5242903.1 hypothetical protein N7469_001230 [Penicillium citrinum]
MIGLQEKPNFSRVVSRIAATENASFSKKGAWMDLVPDEYRLLLGMLDENILSDLVELRLSKNPESLRMHLRKHIEAKAQDYYRLRSKEVEPFEYDQHDDANDVGFGFGCNNSNGTSVTTPDWGSDVHSDPRTDNVDDDPPNLAVPTTATLEESKVSGRVCIYVYHPYTHKSISSIPESLDAEKIFYKVTPTAGSTFEGTKIEDHLITDTVDVTTRNKKKKKKKQKAGARRKSKHTGKKHAERNSGTAAAAETAMGHSSSPKNPTDKEKLTIEAKDMVTTSDVYYNAATYFPDERNLLAPIVPQVAQTMMISPPQRYSSTGSLHITQSPVLQDIINSVETTAMENPQSSTSLQGPGVLHIDENEQMASEPPSNPSHSFVNMRQDSNQFFSSEAKHLIDTPGVERQKFDEDFVLESCVTHIQYVLGNRPVDFTIPSLGVVVGFALCHSGAVAVPTVR